MKSIHQKREGIEREAGSGTIKMYESGIVGYQPSGQNHDGYRRAMKPLRNVMPKTGDVLLTKHFGNK